MYKLIGAIDIYACMCLSRDSLRRIRCELCVAASANETETESETATETDSDVIEGARPG